MDFINWYIKDDLFRNSNENDLKNNEKENNFTENFIEKSNSNNLTQQSFSINSEITHDTNTSFDHTSSNDTISQFNCKTSENCGLKFSIQDSCENKLKEKNDFDVIPDICEKTNFFEDLKISENDSVTSMKTYNTPLPIKKRKFLFQEENKENFYHPTKISKKEDNDFCKILKIKNSNTEEFHKVCVKKSISSENAPNKKITDFFNPINRKKNNDDKENLVKNKNDYFSKNSNSQSLNKIPYSINKKTILQNSYDIQNYSDIKIDKLKFNLIPEKYSSLFKDIQSFNKFQKDLINPIFTKNFSLSIKAPGGSGKNVIFKFAIIKVLKEETNNAKVLYLNPFKTDCEEFLKSIKNIETLGHYCYQLQGDTEIGSKKLNSSTVIVSTPEVFNLYSRKQKEIQHFIENLKLIIIDEIHTVGDEKRGPVLESLITRFKYYEKIHNKFFRFITFSSTIKNIEEIAIWINPDSTKSVWHNSCSLQIKHVRMIVSGYQCEDSLNDFGLDKRITNDLPNLIKKYSDQKSVMIICPTRRIVTDTADFLKQSFSFNNEKEKTELKSYIEKISDPKLKVVLNSGIGFHHSGLTFKDREIIENIYKQNLIKILVSTNNFSMKLPIQLAVIKGTFRYINGNCVQYNEALIQQIIDKVRSSSTDFLNNSSFKPTVIIMTRKKNQNIYEQILNGKKSIESFIPCSFCDLINLEIVLNNINSLQDVNLWFENTFFYLRVFKNPSFYQFEESEKFIKEKLEKFVDKELLSLKNFGIIKYFKCLNATNLEKTKIGVSMAENCVSFSTIKNFEKICAKQSIDQLLEILCSCEEVLTNSVIRNDDKSLINNIMLMKKLRFPNCLKNKEKLKNLTRKIIILIQAYLDCLLDSPELQFLIIETKNIVKILCQLAKGLIDYLFYKSKKDFTTFSNALYLAKSLKAGIWENSEKICRQLPQVGHKLSLKLIENNLTTLKKLKELKGENFEKILGKKLSFGENLVKFLEKIPDYKLEITQKDINSGFLKADLSIKVYLENKNTNPVSLTWLIAGDEENNLLLVEKIESQNFTENFITFELPIDKVGSGIVIFRLIDENFVGSDLEIKFTPRYYSINQKNDANYLENQIVYI